MATSRSPARRTTPAKTAKTAAARKKAAAAKAETKPTPKTVTWRGVNLELPDVLPGTLYFDLADLDDNEGDIALQLRILESLVGPAGIAAVRAQVGEDEIPFNEMPRELTQLLDQVFGAYQSSAGESSASPTS